jgi:hypothetical protein
MDASQDALSTASLHASQDALNIVYVDTPMMPRILLLLTPLRMPLTLHPGGFSIGSIKGILIGVHTGSIKSFIGFVNICSTKGILGLLI